MSWMSRRWTRRLEIVFVYGLPLLALLTFVVMLIVRLFA
jgi:hypothetical protein